MALSLQRVITVYTFSLICLRTNRIDTKARVVAFKYATRNRNIEIATDKNRIISRKRLIKKLDKLIASSVHLLRTPITERYEEVSN